MTDRIPRTHRLSLKAGLAAVMLGAAVLAAPVPAGAAEVVVDGDLAPELSAIADEAVELARERFRLPAADAPAPASASGRSAAADPHSIEAAATGYSIGGTVLARDPDGGTAPAEGVLVELSGPWDDEGPVLDEDDEDWVPGEDFLFLETHTDANGAYSFPDVPDGVYMLWFDPGEDSIYWPETFDVTVAGADVVADDLVLTPVVPLGELEARGAPVVGRTLQVVPRDWLEDTTFTYLWMYGKELSTGPDVGFLDDAVGDRYTVTPEHIGSMILVVVLAEHAGYEPLITLAVWEEPISAPKAAPAPAPVADSGDLGEFLVRHGSTPLPQTAAGLPSGSLSPNEDHTAEVAWDSPDSFVDVYAYSAPAFVGTFAVVDGVVQIPLTSDLLSELGGGEHTLVLLGQSSGDVVSIKLSVAAMLAATGAEPAGALQAGAMLLLLGGALLVVARRPRSRA